MKKSINITKIDIITRLREYGIQISMLGIFFTIWIAFVLSNPAALLNPYLYHALLSTTPVAIILAMPLTLVVICGELDLSFPSIMGVSVLVFTIVSLSTGSWIAALLTALITGCIIGFLNGILVAKVGLPSLIATLGALYFWRGVTMVCSGGWGVPLDFLKGSFLHRILVGRIAGFIPAQSLWMIVFLILFWLILNRHKLGNHILVTGDNEEVARMMGINVKRTKIIVFIIMGFFASMAGLIDALELLNFYPSIGEAFFLNVLAAVFIGGTSPFGGEGTILGTFVGGLIVGLLGVGILAVGLTGFWTQLFFGLIIIVSLVLQVFFRKRIRKG